MQDIGSLLSGGGLYGDQGLSQRVQGEVKRQRIRHLVQREWRWCVPEISGRVEKCKKLYTEDIFQSESCPMKNFDILQLWHQVLTLAKSTELQNVVVPAKKGRGWDDLLTHPECQRLYKGKDFAVTLQVEIPGQEIKILGKKSSEEGSSKPRCS